MNRISPFVRWLAIVGLVGGGVLLARESKLFRLAELDSTQRETAASLSVTAGGSPGNPRIVPGTTAAEQNESATGQEEVAVVQGEIATAAQPSSSLSLVSSSGSVKPLIVESNPAASQEQTICVKGLKATASNVHVALFESQADFPKSELCNKTMVVSSTQDQVTFAWDLPQNKPIAIAVFQDLDGDGRLSKNQIGAPIEPYGFSNNARGMFGPPSFAQAAMTISDGRDPSKPIEIKVR